jgi:hypothetical protein
MFWALVMALVVMVGVCMYLLAGMAGWRDRAKEAESIISEAMMVSEGSNDTRRAYVRSRMRMYCAKWGMVLTKDDNIEEKQA